jgi:hypothetical protein
LLQIKNEKEQLLPTFDVKIKVLKEAKIVKMQERKGPKLIHETHNLESNEDPSIIQK